MTKNLSRTLVLWIPVVAWMAVIFSLSSIPGKDIPDVKLPNFDKLVHITEYAILGILLIRAFSNSAANTSLIKLAIISVCISALYAASDEAHQYFVIDRTPDIMDFLADSIGAIIGVYLYHRRKRSCRS